MSNKKGGFGAKLLIVIILMIASAVAGAYGYRVLDGKMAAKDATKEINNVEVEDYDSVDASTVQSYIDDAVKDLENSKSRQEVYEILTDFKKDVSRVQTKAEKESAEALARQNSQNQNSYNTNPTPSTSDTTEDDNSGGSTGLFNFKSNDSSASAKKKN